MTAAPEIDPSNLDDRVREVFLFIAGVLDTVDDPHSAKAIAVTLRESGLVSSISTGEGAGAWALTKRGDRLLAGLRALEEEAPLPAAKPDGSRTALGVNTPASVVAQVMADWHLGYLREAAKKSIVPADQNVALWFKELGLYAATGEYCCGDKQEPSYVTTDRGKEVLLVGETLRGIPRATRRLDTRKRRATRRSISVKGSTYRRLKVHCDAQGTSVSGFLESILAKALDEAGVGDPPPQEAYPPRSKTARVDEIASQHFTF